MARVRGPYSAAFPVNFTSKGDTTRDAFKKHMDEISRIYGILTDFDKDVANTEGITGESTKHINSTNPHPNYKPSVSWSDLTGKPGLDDLSGTLSASKVKGELTNVTIASGKVTGLEAFVNGKIPASSGDGITNSNLSENGYVKFNNGLIIQWGVSSKSVDTIGHVTFPIKFPNKCLVVSGNTYLKDGNINGKQYDGSYCRFHINQWNESGFGFSSQIESYDNWSGYASYIAIGY